MRIHAEAPSACVDPVRRIKDRAHSTPTLRLAADGLRSLASETNCSHRASGAPAKMLLHFCPGAPREEYFERVPDMRDAAVEERAAFFLDHDTFWV